MVGCRKSISYGIVSAYNMREFTGSSYIFITSNEYIYIYIYIYMCKYIYINIYIYIYIHIYIYIYIYIIYVNC